MTVARYASICACVGTLGAAAVGGAVAGGDGGRVSTGIEAVVPIHGGSWMLAGSGVIGRWLDKRGSVPSSRGWCSTFRGDAMVA